ncbi:MAG: hypothetical protein AWU59_1955 [Methanolobus sp. T82-4]|jgi:hypothetical protein|nr:MAG: hypothetical protein AWU59_1955 [Methanolobus sp. T82-4]
MDYPYDGVVQHGGGTELPDHKKQAPKIQFITGGVWARMLRW